MSGPNSHSSADSALMHYYSLIQQDMHPNNKCCPVPSMCGAVSWRFARKYLYHLAGWVTG